LGQDFAFEVSPECIVLGRCVFHELDELGEVGSYVVDGPLLTDFHLVVERLGQECMRLAHLPEFSLSVWVDQLLVLGVSEEFELVVDGHADEVGVAPLGEVFIFLVEQLVLLFPQSRHAVIMLSVQISDGSLHLPNSLAFKSEVLEKLCLVSLQELRHLLQLGTPLGKRFH
jgi:hypothetical protein